MCKWNKTRNKSDEAVVRRFVTIARTEEDEFKGLVLECAVKFTIIMKEKKPWLSRCPM